MRNSRKVPMTTSLNIRLSEAELLRVDSLVAEGKAKGEKVNRSRIVRQALVKALA